MTTLETSAASAPEQDLDAPEQGQVGHGLFPGDTGDADEGLRTVLTYLVKHPVLMRQDEPDLWDELMVNLPAVRRHFHNMCVEVRVNTELQVAFKEQVEPEGMRVFKLVRQATLSHEAAVLMIHLRARLTRTATNEVAVLTLAEAVETVEAVIDVGGNRAGFIKKVKAACATLAKQRLLDEVKTDTEWIITPVVQVLLTPETIERFLDSLTAPTDDAPGSDDPGPSDPEELA